MLYVALEVNFTHHILSFDLQGQINSIKSKNNNHAIFKRKVLRKCFFLTFVFTPLEHLKFVEKKNQNQKIDLQSLSLLDFQIYIKLKNKKRAIEKCVLTILEMSFSEKAFISVLISRMKY